VLPRRKLYEPLFTVSPRFSPHAYRRSKTDDDVVDFQPARTAATP